MWTRFRENGEFKNISKNLFDALKHISPHAHHHPDPIPHVTLARTKGEFSSDEFELDVDVEERELRAEKAELWQTLQGKNGVDYISLEKFKFIQ